MIWKTMINFDLLKNEVENKNWANRMMRNNHFLFTQSNYFWVNKIQTHGHCVQIASKIWTKWMVTIMENHLSKDNAHPHLSAAKYQWKINIFYKDKRTSSLLFYHLKLLRCYLRWLTYSDLEFKIPDYPNLLWFDQHSKSVLNQCKFHFHYKFFSVIFPKHFLCYIGIKFLNCNFN